MNFLSTFENESVSQSLFEKKILDFECYGMKKTFNKGWKEWLEFSMWF